MMELWHFPIHIDAISQPSIDVQGIRHTYMAVLPSSMRHAYRPPTLLTRLRDLQASEGASWACIIPPRLHGSFHPFRFIATGDLEFPGGKMVLIHFIFCQTGCTANSYVSTDRNQILWHELTKALSNVRGAAFGGRPMKNLYHDLCFCARLFSN